MGEKIVVEVTFDRAIDITGEPTLQIELGNQLLTLTGQASGDSAIAFEYTVVANDQDDDGIGVVSNSLSGTVKDSTGAVSAVLTHSAADIRQAVVDTQAPALIGAYFNGVALSLAYDSVLNNANLPDVGDFVVRVAGEIVELDSLGLSASGQTLELSLSIAEEVSYAGQAATVTYVRNTNAATGVRDLYGNFAANLVTPQKASSGSPPSGAVTISGAAREDEELSVSNSLVDADGIIGSVSYQWKFNGDNVLTGGTGTALTLTQADVGKLVSVVATYRDGLGNIETVSSKVLGPVANVNDAREGQVRVTGDMVEGATLRAIDELTDADGKTQAASFQWYADRKPIAQATTSELTLSQALVGSVITVVASYTDALGTPETFETNYDANRTVQNVQQEPLGAVSITLARANDVSVKVGDVLSVNSTLVDPDGVAADGGLSYQWTADGANITGANGTTFTVNRDQALKVVGVQVTITDVFGVARPFNASTGTPAQKVNSQGTGALVLSATLPVEGQVLSASTALLADADGLGAITVQWKDNANNVLGQGSELTLTQAMVGTTITATASYTDGQGFAETKSSAVFGPIRNLNQSPQGTVSIQESGSVVTLAAQGKVLHAVQNLSDFDGLGTLTYQWTADDLDTATGPTLSLGQSHVGKTIGLRVKYNDLQGTAESVASSNTVTVSNVNDAPQGALAIVGAAQVGTRLTLNNTLSDVDGIPTTGGNALRYQWLADGVQIMGAKGAELTLTPEMAGKAISVQARYVDNQGTEESYTSAATAAVGITVSGTPGNDDIQGARGVDTFTGGEGRDIFLVSANASTLAPDSITDFSPADDVLLVDLESFGYVLSTLGLTSGDSPTTEQFVAGPLTTQTGPVFYLNAGTLYFDPDGVTTAQPAKALVAVTLVGASMSAQDIVF